MCDKFGSTNVDNDAYLVQNNEWGASDGQCITTNAGPGFTVDAGEHHKDDSPAAYPSMMSGCWQGTCTRGTTLPARISGLGPISSSIAGTIPAGVKSNLAYDIWADSTPKKTGQNDAMELMIWLKETGGIAPIGSNSGTVTIGGATWDVWKGTNGGVNVISYVRQGYVDSADNLPITDFVKDAVKQGSVKDSDYLTNIQAGFEPWTGGPGLTLSKFSVTTGGESASASPASRAATTTGAPTTTANLTTKGSSAGSSDTIDSDNDGSDIDGSGTSDATGSTSESQPAESGTATTTSAAPTAAATSSDSAEESGSDANVGAASTTAAPSGTSSANPSTSATTTTPAGTATSTSSTESAGGDDSAGGDSTGSSTTGTATGAPEAQGGATGASTGASWALSNGLAGFQSTPWNNEGAEDPVAAASPNVPGRQGVKFVVPGGGKRSEVQPENSEYQAGEDKFFGYSAYLDKDFATDADSWQVIWQLHDGGTNGSPPVALEIQNGKLWLAAVGDLVKDLGPVSPGQNLAVQIEVKFEQGGGSVNVWRDGQQVLSNYTPPKGTMVDGSDYLKLGIYRDPSEGQTSTLYLNDLKIGDSLASVGGLAGQSASSSSASSSSASPEATSGAGASAAAPAGAGTAAGLPFLLLLWGRGRSTTPGRHRRVMPPRKRRPGVRFRSRRRDLERVRAWRR